MKLPNYYARNIFDIPTSFFLEHNFKFILCDLDNTLDQYDTLIPSLRVRKLKEEYVTAGLEIIIISNNTEKRVKHYAGSLNVKYLAKAGKPFGKRLSNYLNKLAINKKECILLGDQLLTDVPCSLRAGIKVILLDPISKKDQITTRFNRLLDRPRRKKLIKLGKLKYAEEIYGKKN